MIHRASWYTFTAALALTALCPATAKAEVVFTSFGPSDSFYTGIGWTIGTGFNGVQGDQFASSASGTLSSIDVAMGYVAGPNVVDFTLYTDSGNAPGSVLETWSVASPLTFGNTVPLLTLTSSLHPFLSAGSDYWLIADAPNSSSAFAWDLNNQGITGNHYSNGAVGPNTLGAFRVNVDSVSSVPEPGVTAFGILAGGSLVGLIARKRRRA